MEQRDYEGEDFQVTPDTCVRISGRSRTLGVIEIPALADPLEEQEELTLDEIRGRCGYAPMTMCRTCNHPQRAEIERAVMTESVNSVAKRYGLSKPALLNHMKNHFSV